MTKEKAVSLLSQMFLIQFSKEEHEALAMAINALNIDRKTEPTGYNLSPVDKDINVRSKDESQNIELSKVKSELNEWRDIIGDDVVDDIISNLEEKADEDEP